MPVPRHEPVSPAAPAPQPEVTALAFDVTAALMIVLDVTGRILRFNRACERLTGYREADVQGQLLWPLVLDVTEARRAEEAFAHLNPHGEPGSYENYWMNRQGEPRFIRWTTTFRTYPDGQVELVVATGIDVTEERRARQALQEQETLFRALFEHSADGVVLLDPSGPGRTCLIVQCNAAYARLYGYAPGELIGQSMDVLRGEPTSMRKPEDLGWLRAQPHGVRLPIAHRHRDGRTLQIESNLSLLRIGERELVLCVDRDVTVTREQEATLHRMNAHLEYTASHDALTGLLNRPAWLARLTAALTVSGPVAVLFLDLDGFKHVNDTWGHATGDALLQAVAERLRETLRPVDGIGRLGGDEFAVLLTTRRPDAALGVAARLEQVIGRPYEVLGHTAHIGVSIGLSHVGPEDREAEEVLRRADQAMYAIKGTRTGRIRPGGEDAG